MTHVITAAHAQNSEAITFSLVCHRPLLHNRGEIMALRKVIPPIKRLSLSMIFNFLFD